MYMPRAPYKMYLLTTTETGACRQMLTLAGVAVSWDGSGLVLIGTSPSANVPSSTQVQSEHHNLCLLSDGSNLVFLYMDLTYVLKLKNDRSKRNSILK